MSIMMEGTRAVTIYLDEGTPITLTDAEIQYIEDDIDSTKIFDDSCGQTSFEFCAEDLSEEIIKILQCEQTTIDQYYLKKFKELEKYIEYPEPDYDRHFKRYDNIQKKQFKQYELSRCHNKNFPYRRCDRSR